MSLKMTDGRWIIGILFFLAVPQGELRKLSNYIDTGNDTGHDVGEASDQKGVCYGDLGCFTLEGPWFSILRPIPLLPEEPDKINTRFFLNTRSAGREEIETRPEISLDGTSYDGSKWTYFIVHGFTSDTNATWVTEMEDALLEKVDANIISVDWKDGAASINYAQVTANTRVVGAEGARLARYLVEHEGASPERMHLIGHSLGAHTASYIANGVTRVKRITGLDPAQPEFEGADKLVRLDDNDAEFVDIIHTNGIPFIPLFGLGMMSAIGHVDFFLNGGRTQPGCIIPKELPPVHSVKDFLLLPITVLSGALSCSHTRAPTYFNEALRGDCILWARINEIPIVGSLTQLFRSNQCSLEKCQVMGLETPELPARGKFHLKTNGKEPYCKEDPQTDEIMGKALERFWG